MTKQRYVKPKFLVYGNISVMTQATSNPGTASDNKNTGQDKKTA